MGCAPSRNVLPPHPSITDYWPVVQVKLARGETIRTYRYGSGLVYVNNDILCYDANGGIGRLRIPIDGLTSVEASRDFRDQGTYFYPCYCCGWGDGIVDIRGNYEGTQIHIGFFAIESVAMVEGLDRILQKKRLMYARNGV